MEDEGGSVTMSYGRRESLVLAEDVTELFGSQRSIDGRLPRVNECICLLLVYVLCFCNSTADAQVQSSHCTHPQLCPLSLRLT